jgi:hypothetical protein
VCGRELSSAWQLAVELIEVLCDAPPDPRLEMGDPLEYSRLAISAQIRFVFSSRTPRSACKLLALLPDRRSLGGGVTRALKAAEADSVGARAMAGASAAVGIWEESGGKSAGGAAGGASDRAAIIGGGSVTAARDAPAGAGGKSAWPESSPIEPSWK